MEESLGNEHPDDVREALLSVLSEIPVSSAMLAKMVQAGGLTKPVTCRVDRVRGDDVEQSDSSDNDTSSDDDQTNRCVQGSCNTRFNR